MKLIKNIIKNIVKFITTITIFPTWKSWKIRYTTDDQKHRITYEIGHSDVDAVARLQKSIKGKIEIISCQLFID